MLDFSAPVLKRQGLGNSSSVAYAKAAATGPDGSMFIGGVGAQTAGEDSVFHSTVFHLASNGSLIWEWKVGTCTRWIALLVFIVFVF